jgi:hypothetical protein
MMYDSMAVPAEMPMTIPVAATTLATEVLALCHVPPAVLWVNVVGVLAHIVAGPSIGGIALTVREANDRQVLGSV